MKDKSRPLARLRETDEFAAELLRLIELAPEPWATQLRAILESAR